MNIWILIFIPFFGRGVFSQSVAVIEPCNPNPCNGYGCMSRGRTYTCQCEDGSTGRNCETATCTSSSCEDGTTCGIVNNQVICTCPPETNGISCTPSIEVRSCVPDTPSNIYLTAPTSIATLRVLSHPDNANCIFIVRAAPGRVATFTLTSLNLEQPTNGTCSEKLTFLDGFAYGIASVCGCINASSSEDELTYTGGLPNMVLYLTSGGSGQMGSFTGTVGNTDYRDVLCSERTTLTGSAGTFSSNPGAKLYANNMDCLFRIIPSEPFDTLQLWFTKFDLASGDTLIVHRMLVDNFGDVIQDNRIAITTGNEVFEAPSNARLSVEFRSDRAGCLSGFQAFFRTS